MKTNSLILKRFGELEAKAKKLWDEADREHELKTYVDEDRGIIQELEVVNVFVDVGQVSGWATSCLNLFQRVFGADGIHYKNFHETYGSFVKKGESALFRRCMFILEASREDYEGGYLFDVRGLVRAEVFDDVLEQASELLRVGYKDAACVVAGVALETTLKELCARKSIPYGKLDRMNNDLYKNGEYNLVLQKQITAWAERRNKAAHGEWSHYNEADVQDMISGVTRLVAEYLG